MNQLYTKSPFLSASLITTRLISARVHRGWRVNYSESYYTFCTFFKHSESCYTSCTVVNQSKCYYLLCMYVCTKKTCSNTIWHLLHLIEPTIYCLC